MREIKFRALNHEFKETGMGFYYSDEYSCLSDFFQFLELDADKETLGQFTGLKDKNGKEIYEGDIVKCMWASEYKIEREINKVIFHESFLQFYCYNKINLFKSRLPLHCYHEIEVIGNIYENPELLEVKQ